MRGYEPRSLYDAFLVADAAACEWMGEETRRQHERAKQGLKRG